MADDKRCNGNDTERKGHAARKVIETPFILYTEEGWVNCNYLQ